MTEKSKRIKKATRKSQLDQTAERVANIVNAERPVAPATLRGLVHEETVSNTAALQREVQSLKAKMDSLLVGKEKGGNQKKKKKPPATKSHHDGSSKRVSNQAQVKNRGVAVAKPAPYLPPSNEPETEPEVQPPPQKTKGLTHRKANQVGRRPPTTRRITVNCADRARSQNDTWFSTRPFLLDSSKCT